MKTLKVPLKNAEKAKNFLIENNALDKTKRYSKEENCIYYPLTKEVKTELGVVEDKELPNKKKKVKTLNEAVKEILNNDELKEFNTGLDVIGDIAIINVNDNLQKKEKELAELILKNNKNVKTVLKKASIHEGIYRTQKYTFLAGKNTKETVHKENNVKIKLNIETVYYSQRMSTERKRIANLINKDENVLVLYSGCAPYLLVISKIAKPKQIVGVELNKEGHDYGVENIKLNKMNNIILINEDVGEALKELKDEYDRIVMPAPDNAKEHIEIIAKKFEKAKNIHYYDFSTEEGINELENKIKSLFNQKTTLKTVKCGNYAPGKYRVCVDIRKL